MKTSANQLCLFGVFSLLTSATYAQNTIRCSGTPQVLKRSETEAIPHHKMEAQVSFNETGFSDVPFFMFERPYGEHPAVFRKSTNFLSSDTDDTSNNTWHGELDGNNHAGAATLIRTASGGVAGSFSIEGIVYQMNTMPNGTVTMRVVASQDFPDEEHDEEAHQDEHGNENPAGPSAIDDTTEKPVDDHASHRLLAKSRYLRAKKKSVTTMHHVGNKKHRKLQSTSAVVDVLVLYTARSMCAEAGKPAGCEASAANKAPMEQLIQLAEEETNVAYQESGMSTRIRVVGKHLDTTGFNEMLGDFSYSLNALKGTSDGQLDYVHEMRDSLGADLVTMIINQDESCGRGMLNGPFSVVAARCATGYYSFAHELGHGFGCHHDRNNANPQPFAHGYQDSNGRFRSVMAYRCPSGTCPRVQRFSNPHTMYLGGPIGDSSNDCARRIDERAPIVAGWKTAPASGGGGGGTVGGTCSDSPSGWHDAEGEDYDCAWYAFESRCAEFGDGYADGNGVTANMACCACGGGSSTSNGSDGGGNGSATCSSSPSGWHDSDGPLYSCEWYGQEPSRCAEHGDSYENFGKTANEACCECGGGSTTSNAADTKDSSSVCADSPQGWHDSEDETFDCNWYSQGDNCDKYGDGFARLGKTAKEACCACGGGSS